MVPLPFTESAASEVYVTTAWPLALVVPLSELNEPVPELRLHVTAFPVKGAPALSVTVAVISELLVPSRRIEELAASTETLIV